MGPLGAGQYSVWVQDDKPFKYDYSFEIGVPEPSTWAMMLIGFAALCFAGYRSSSCITVASGNTVCDSKRPLFPLCGQPKNWKR
jgi:hypothetical protein